MSTNLRSLSLKAKQQKVHNYASKYKTSRTSMKMGHSTRKWMMGNPELEKSLVELERQKYWGLLPARLAVNWTEG